MGSGAAAMDAMSNWLGFSLSQRRQHGGSVVEDHSSLSSAAMKHGDGDDSYHHHHHHHHDDESVILVDSAQPGSFTAQMLEIATMSPQEEEEDGGKEIGYYHHHHHHHHHMVVVDHHPLHITETCCRKDWQSEEEEGFHEGAAEPMSQTHEYGAYELNYGDGVVDMMGMQQQQQQEVVVRPQMQKLMSHGPVLEDFLGGISSSSNLGGPEQQQQPYGGNGGGADDHLAAAHNYEQRQRQQQQQGNPFHLSAAAAAAPSSYRSAASPSGAGYSLPPHLFPADSCTTPHHPQQQQQQQQQQQEKTQQHNLVASSSFHRSCLQLAGRFPLEDDDDDNNNNNNNNSSYGFLHDGLLASSAHYPPPLSLPRRHPAPSTAFNAAGDETASISRIGGYKDSSQRFCFSAMPDSRFLQMPQTTSTTSMLRIRHSSEAADRQPPSFVPTRNFSSLQSSWMDAMLPTDDDQDDDDSRSCRSNCTSSTDHASIVLFKGSPRRLSMMEDCNAAYSSLQAGDGVVEGSDHNNNNNNNKNNNAVAASNAHPPAALFTLANLAWDGSKTENAIDFPSIYMMKLSSTNSNGMNCGADVTTVAGRPSPATPAGNARNPDNMMQQHWLMESAAVSPPSHEASCDLVLLKPPASDAHPQTRNSPDPPAPFDERLALSPMTALHPIIDPSVKTDDSCAGNNTNGITVLSSSKKRASTATKSPSTEAAGKAASDTFGQRTSQYRGVTRHRWTGRYEAHLWDNSCRIEGQTRKGRQVYLGGYDREDKAARAYDLAALKFWGPSSHINFPLSTYEKELEEMKNMTRQEFVASLRRKSTGFSRGASVYRGVTRHHQQGRWQARIGRVAGSKDLYLGTYSTQEEAAEAYDIAAIKFRGPNAVTNFDISRYDVQMICSSSSNNILPRELNRKKASASSPSSSNIILPPSQVVEEAAALRLQKVEDDETETVIMERRRRGVVSEAAAAAKDGRQQEHQQQRIWECNKNGFSRHIDLIASAITRHEAYGYYDYESRETLFGSGINVNMVKLEENGEGISSGAAQSPARAFLMSFHGQSDHETTTAAVMRTGNGGISGDADCCWNDPSAAEEEAEATTASLMSPLKETSSESQGPGQRNRPSDPMDMAALEDGYRLMSNEEGSSPNKEEEEEDDDDNDDGTVNTEAGGGSHELEVVLEGDFSEVGTAAGMGLEKTEKSIHSEEEEEEEESSRRSKKKKKKKNYEWWAFPAATTVGSVVQ